MSDIDVDAIRARCEVAMAAPAFPVGPMLDAWVLSLRDLPAALDEIDRLRAAAANGARGWT